MGNGNSGISRFVTAINLSPNPSWGTGTEGLGVTRGELRNS